MWNESDIDMEELEARLYGQVHHPTTEDFASFEIPYNNTQEYSSNVYGRYFNESRNRKPVCNFKNGYQRSPYFKRPTRNFESNANPMPNFYNPIGYVPEIALNNIVVLPPPSTHIYTQPQFSIQNFIKERRRKRQREKRKGKRDLARKLSKENSNKKTFKEHYLLHNKPAEPLSNSQNDCQIIEPEKEIICVTESDSSDCEIANEKESFIILSSDDEDTKEKLPPVDVKCETEIKSPINDLEKQTVESKHASLETISTDDDVILVESKPDEVIVISGDDIQAATSSGNESNASSSLDSNVIIPSILTNKESLCRPGTPESTNDFLENSFSESNDASLNASRNSQCLRSKKSGFDVSETDSSSSASDIENPCRNSTFIEQEFDVPPENPLSELNLDSFTDYIASGNKNPKGSLTPKNSKSPKSSASGTTKGNENKSNTNRNSSDSSSESDYEDNKVTLVKDESKAKRKLNLRSRVSSETSEDDCFVVEHSFGKNASSTSTPLPNLSPITSDEEIDYCKKDKKTDENLEIKTKKIQKNETSPPSTSNSGEKRKYPKELLKFIKSKRAKENETSVKAQIEESSESSNELSEVEVIHAPDNEKSNLDSSVKILNIDATPKPPVGKTLDQTHKTLKFKDYWTEDMNKFYFESWGQEDFSLEQAKKNMSDSPQKWKILAKDRLYNKTTPKGRRCNRCNEYGHRAISCKVKPKPIICSVCGGVGHFNTRCPESICTSCGRKSHSLTNYCSRCTDLRRIKCRTCSQYGHTDSHCPDLWRRYHLTTKSGPLKQPENFNLKPSKDRWCSGCACNGHFEHECHYYNRTHAPTNPAICSYADVYETSNTSTRETPRNNINIPHNSSRNNSYINPWVVNNVQNRYAFQQPQQQCGMNQNFIQQLPIFQSPVSSIFTLSKGSNVFCQNPNMMFSNQFVPQNVFHQNQQLSNSSLENFTPTNNQLQVEENEKPQRHYLNFNCIKGQVLVRSEFLKELADASSVNISIKKRKKNKKFNYLCTVEGPRQDIVSVSKKIQNFVDDYVAPATPLMQMFLGKDFSLSALEECLAHISNPRVNWVNIARRLFRKIKENEEILMKCKDAEKIGKFQNKLKNQYTALNAAINGKSFVENGTKHMEILRQYNKSKHLNDDQLRKLKESYDYVFNNPNKLNIAYTSLISDLPTSMALVEEMASLLDSGLDLCVDNNLPGLARTLRGAYKILVRKQYPEKLVLHIKKLYDVIKSKTKNVHK